METTPTSVSHATSAGGVLGVVTEAARTAERTARGAAPWWAYPSVALLGPLAVSVDRLAGPTRVAVSGALACVIVAALVVSGVRFARARAAARPRFPVYRGWAVLFATAGLGCFVLGVRLVEIASGMDSGLALAGVSWFVAGVPSAVFQHLADRTMDRHQLSPG